MATPAAALLIRTRPSQPHSAHTQTPVSASSAHPDPAHNQDPTFTVTQNPNTFSVRQLTAAFVPCLYRLASNGKIRILELTPVQKDAFEKAIEQILEHPDIKDKIAGKTIERIDFNNLYIHLKGETTPIPFTSDLNPVNAVRKICNDHVDKDGKQGGVSWPNRSRGERATVLRNTPRAYERPNNHLKTIQFTKEDEANALSNWIRPPHTKDNLKSLKERHTAIALKDSWLAYLDEQKRKTPNKETKEQIEKIEAELNGISDFALRFEMAHPLLAPGMIQAKEKKALELLNDPARLPVEDGLIGHAKNKMKSSWGREEADLEANKAFAKDLALSSLTDHLQYKEATEALGSPMKHDSLQDAFANLARAIVAAESETTPAAKQKVINDALAAPKLQFLFQLAPSSTFREEMRAHLNQQIAAIHTAFDTANLVGNPFTGRKSIDLIDNFDARIFVARKMAIERVLQDADRLAADTARFLDGIGVNNIPNGPEIQDRSTKWAQKSVELSQQLATLPQDQIAAAEAEADAIQKALRQINDYLNL